MDVIRHMRGSIWASALGEYEKEMINNIIGANGSHTKKFDLDREGHFSMSMSARYDMKPKNDWFYNTKATSSRGDAHYRYWADRSCDCYVDGPSDCECSAREDFEPHGSDLSHLYANDVYSECGIVQAQEVVKMPNANVEILVSLLDAILEEKEDKLTFFGVLIVTESGLRMNPLHPFIATLINDGSLQLPPSFTIMVYPLSGNSQETIDMNMFADSIEQIADVTSFLKSNTVVQASQYAEFLGLDNSRIMKDDIGERHFRFSDISAEDKIAATPVQFLVGNGVLYPFYGLIQSEKVDRDGDGMAYYSQNLFPFRSPNINTDYNEGLGGTCTGSESNRLFKSLPVMNMGNMGSPYHHDCIPWYWSSFIKAAQQFSASLITSKFNKKD